MLFLVLISCYVANLATITKKSTTFGINKMCWGKMGKFEVKWVGLKIWINFVKIFVQALPLTRIAQTTLLDIVNADLSFPGPLFSSN